MRISVGVPIAAEVGLVVMLHKPAANDAPIHPRTRLIAPDGSVARQRQGFVGPAEIGLAARRPPGEPIYFQMECENQ
jgi:hypothetical protein